MKRETLLKLLQLIYQLEPEVFFKAIENEIPPPLDDGESEWALFNRIEQNTTPEFLQAVLEDALAYEPSIAEMPAIVPTIRDKMRLEAANQFFEQMRSLLVVNGVEIDILREYTNSIIPEYLESDLYDVDWDAKTFLQELTNKMEGSDDEYDFTIYAVQKFATKYFGIDIR